MYISQYMYVSTQLLLAGADDNPQHHCPEAALVDVPRHLVVIMFRVLISRHQHTVFRRFIIEPGVRPQHHWQRLIGRTIDGLLQAGHGVSDNVIDNYYSSNVSRHPRDGHDQSLIMINLSSWLSTSGHLSPWQHLTTIAPTSGWTS